MVIIASASVLETTFTCCWWAFCSFAPQNKSACLHCIAVMSCILLGFFAALLKKFGWSCCCRFEHWKFLNEIGIYTKFIQKMPVYCVKKAVIGEKTNLFRQKCAFVFEILLFMFQINSGLHTSWSLFSDLRALWLLRLVKTSLSLTSAKSSVIMNISKQLGV